MSEKNQNPIVSFLEQSCVGFEGDAQSFVLRMLSTVNFTEKEWQAIAAVLGIPDRNPMSKEVVVKQFGLFNVRALDHLLESFNQQIGQAIVLGLTPKPLEWWEMPHICTRDAPPDEKGRPRILIQVTYPNGTVADLPPVLASMSLGKMKQLATEFLRNTWDAGCGHRASQSTRQEMPALAPPMPLPSLNPNLFRPIEYLEVRCRVINAFRNAVFVKPDGRGILIGDLVQFSETDLLRIKNFGGRSLYDVKNALGRLNLHLSTKIDDWPKQVERWSSGLEEEEEDEDEDEEDEDEESEG